MKHEIPDEIREYLRYDEKTGHLHWIKARPGVTLGSRAGAINSRGYRVVRFNGTLYRAHRVCWFLHYGVQPGESLDHIDQQKDNNRIDNLREATHSMQMVNRADFEKESGLPKNVYVHKNRFQARIKRNGKEHYLGTFPTPNEASQAVQAFISGLPQG
jgi:CRISPR/Cas system CSM-associated protein Csm3 (group 7 of RAMP superfamily)